MTSQTLIDTMERLYKLHKDLHKVAVEKTVVLKENDVQALAKLLREEQKLIAEIQVANNKREQVVQQLAGKQDAPISEVIESVEGSDRDKLSNLQKDLASLLEELKSTNDLNQQLLQFSLQMVNMNLDMLAPEPELPNYTRTREEADHHAGNTRSAFDSKA